MCKFCVSEIMKTFIEISTVINTPIRFWLGPQLAIILDKPDDIQAILTSPNCYEKPYIYKFFHNDLSILTSTSNLYFIS